jgi:hypothetical protein
MDAFLTINKYECPYPARGLKFQVADMVNDARNANGVMVGQRVGRELQQMEVEWAFLKADDWKAILNELKKFYLVVKYPDMLTGTMTTRSMYPGNRHAEVFKINPITNIPTEYINCKVNLIDIGARNV